MDERMPMTLAALAGKIEKAVPEARCQVITAQGQIVVQFKNRPDVELSLLTPMQQRQLQDGYLDPDDYSELIFTLRKIANAQ